MKTALAFALALPLALPLGLALAVYGFAGAIAAACYLATGDAAESLAILAHAHNALLNLL